MRHFRRFQIGRVFVLPVSLKNNFKPSRFNRKAFLQLSALSQIRVIDEPSRKTSVRFFAFPLVETHGSPMAFIGNSSATDFLIVYLDEEI